MVGWKDCYSNSDKVTGTDANLLAQGFGIYQNGCRHTQAYVGVQEDGSHRILIARCYTEGIITLAGEVRDSDVSSLSPTRHSEGELDDILAAALTGVSKVSLPEEAPEYLSSVYDTFPENF